MSDIYVKPTSETLNIESLLGKKLIAKIYKELPGVENQVIDTATEELIKFLYLAARAQSSLFLPGDEIVDQVWHQVILETKIYQSICDSFGGGFLHHTGISLDDYIDHGGAEQVNQEQLTWLANYYHCFGEITPAAFSLLPMARGLATRMNLDLNKLNELAKILSDSAS